MITYIVGIVIVVLCIVMVRIGMAKPVLPRFVRRYGQRDYGSDNPLPPEMKAQAEMRRRLPRLFYGTGYDDVELWAGSQGNMTKQERRGAGYDKKVKS